MKDNMGYIIGCKITIETHKAFKANQLRGNINNLLLSEDLYMGDVVK
jgi:hypothetical protein